MFSSTVSEIMSSGSVYIIVPKLNARDKCTTGKVVKVGGNCPRVTAYWNLLLICPKAARLMEKGWKVNRVSAHMCVPQTLAELGKREVYPRAATCVAYF